MRQKSYGKMDGQTKATMGDSGVNTLDPLCILTDF